MPTIQLDNVTKLYKIEKRPYAAVSEIDLTIKQGEFVFIVGSSGAGKSTLMQLISGTIRPNKGSVKLDNLNLGLVPPWFRPMVYRSFGIVRQESQLMRKRTIHDNLMMAVRAGIGVDKEQMKEKVTKALGIVGMSGKGPKYPGELSLGECRRIELARAIINSPPILMLDELTANLDEDGIWDMMHLLTHMNHQGTTVVMATHASMFVNILRRRVITLVDGQIAADMERGRYGEIRGQK